MEEVDRRLQGDRLEPVPIFGLALEDLKRPMREILEALEVFLMKCLETHSGAWNWPIQR